MNVKLTWTDRNTNEDGHRIYRSSTPMDTQAMPPPVAELGPDVTEWEDTDTPVDQVVYYIVSALRGAEEAFSYEVVIDTAPMDTRHKHWRIRLVKTREAADFKAMLAEVEFREHAGGPNLAVGGVATALSFHSANPAHHAFDGNPSTSWSSDSGTYGHLPQWIAYEFPSEVDVREVLLQASDTEARAARAPEDFYVEYSDDGVVWFIAKSYLGQPTWVAGETRAFSVSIRGVNEPNRIGQAFGGGFYCGDSMYQSQPLYLVVAPIEADVYGLQWGPSLSIATVDSDGVFNTDIMVSSPDDYPAAQYCATFYGGGNDDWYMPSRDELLNLQFNLRPNLPDTPEHFKTGGVQAFSSTHYYWSSTHSSNQHAWVVRPQDGLLTSIAKIGGDLRVRPIRRILAPSPPPPPLPTVIGEEFGGGFYAGDIQYPDGQWYKLIIADKAADITGENSRWKTSLTTTAGTDNLTDGVANTDAMVAAGIELHPAADHCINHSGGGNSDWYMAANDELNVIYQNLGYARPNCPPDFQSSGPQAFSNAWYWASTQESSDIGWVQHFSSGSQNSSLGKTGTTRRVRPVRRIAFTPEAPTLPTTIGEEFGGGYYIGDITIADGGGDDGTYAIIMAELESQATLAWKDPHSTTVGADSTANGLANTLAMQADDPAIHFAGMHCLNYRGDDRDDWYLPAKDELNLAWVNRADLAELAVEAQGYWSSTQGSSDDAWRQSFSSGYQGTNGKISGYRVRPVRRIKKS